MSAASLGRSREYHVRDLMIDYGWEPIMRASSSKGAADLLMAHEDHGAALIQVGSRTKTLGPLDRRRLLAAARLCSALPVLAIVIPRQPVRYWLVEDGVPSTWEEWKP